MQWLRRELETISLLLTKTGRSVGGYIEGSITTFIVVCMMFIPASQYQMAHSGGKSTYHLKDGHGKVELEKKSIVQGL